MLICNDFEYDTKRAIIIGPYLDKIIGWYNTETGLIDRSDALFKLGYIKAMYKIEQMRCILFDKEETVPSLHSMALRRFVSHFDVIM